MCRVEGTIISFSCYHQCPHEALEQNTLHAQLLIIYYTDTIYVEHICTVQTLCLRWLSLFRLRSLDFRKLKHGSTMTAQDASTETRVSSPPRGGVVCFFCVRRVGRPFR